MIFLLNIYVIIAFQRAYSRLLKVISAPAVTIWVSDPPKSANGTYLYKLVVIYGILAPSYWLGSVTALYP